MVWSISYQHKWLKGFTALWIGLLMTLSPHLAGAQTISSKEAIQRILVIEKLSVREGVVSGEVHNRSRHTVREVQLFIRHTWLWDNEFNPGKADPGTSTYYTLQKEIPAAGRLPFTYTPSPPLPKVAGGHFETSVSIAGFAEVIPQVK